MKNIFHVFLITVLTLAARAADPRVNDTAVVPRSAVSDTAYDATTWDANVDVPTKNAVRDKIETLSSGTAPSDTAYASSWNGVTTISPSKNAVYDYLHLLDTDDDSDVDVAGGGTGVKTLTAYAPLFGGTTATGPVQSGTAGTAGNVLTSNGAGVLPTFQAPAAGGVTTSSTDTLTNKRITPRVATLTDAATVTPATDSFDGGKLTTLSQATAIANPTGTPTAFQVYKVRIKSTTARALTWGSQYRGSLDLTLPSTTSGSSLTDYLIFQYNSDDTKWDLVGKNFGF